MSSSCNKCSQLFSETETGVHLEPKVSVLNLVFPEEDDNQCY